MKTFPAQQSPKAAASAIKECFLPSERLTIIEAKVKVGEGEALYIRGRGKGLNWHSGQPLSRGFGGSWIWKASNVRGKMRFSLLLNDRIWAKGKHLTLEAGKMIQLAPSF